MYSWFGVLPFRCESCDARFLRFTLSERGGPRVPRHGT